jgi:hypothetical protein
MTASSSETSFAAYLARRPVVMVLAVVAAASLASRLALTMAQLESVDTQYFLAVVDMIHGRLPLNGEVPYRLANPLFSLLAVLFEPVTVDWLAAARWASMVPAILLPPTIVILALYLRRSVLAGAVAGGLAICSLPLMEMASYPLSDGPFTLLCVLTLTAAVAYLRQPSLPRMTAFGICAGLAWSMRAQGLFLPLLVFVPLLIEAIFFRRSGEKAGPAVFLRCAAMLFSGLVVFVIVGRGPTVAIERSFDMARLSAGPDYAKLIILDGGIRYFDAETVQKRIYDLDPSANDYLHSHLAKTLSWPELLADYGTLQAKAALKNLQRNWNQSIPEALSPFVLLFVPFALGLANVWRRRPWTESLAVLLFLFPFVFVVPLFQQQDRYVYPIAAVALPLAGIGATSVWRAMKGLERRAGVLARWSLAACIVLAALYGVLGGARLHGKQNADFSAELAAARWVKEHSTDDPNRPVIASYSGLYVHEHVHKLPMPSAAPEKVTRFALNRGIRFVILGSKERAINAAFSRLFDDGDTVTAATAQLKKVASFPAAGRSPVLVIEVLPRQAATSGFPKQILPRT